MTETSTQVHVCISAYPSHTITLRVIVACNTNNNNIIIIILQRIFMVVSS